MFAKNTYQSIDGRKVALFLQDSLKKETLLFKQNTGETPHLAIVLVGNHPASETYVNAKIKACQQIGFKATRIDLPIETCETQLLEIIEQLNRRKDVHGFIVQLPLPAHIDTNSIIMAISPSKDVDGFHPENVGRMVLDLPAFIAATPFGITKLLEYYAIETQGKKCVVIGRSNLVGSPMSILMAKNSPLANCTVTLTHSQTKDLSSITQQADILIVALGVPQFLKKEMVKKGAVVIDVGIHRIKDETTEKGYRLCGDVDFENVAPACSYISPVPGGVGPMTIATLLQNTLLAAKHTIYPKID